MRLAARQIGHHWHSGDSPTSGGISLVAVSQTSAALACCRPPPRVRRTWLLTSRLILRALARSSLRCRSLSMSLAGVDGRWRAEPDRCGPDREESDGCESDREEPDCEESDGSDDPLRSD